MKIAHLVFCLFLVWGCKEEDDDVRTTGIELGNSEPILPRAGQWIYDVWEWTAHECGVSEEDLPIDSYDGFKIPLSQGESFKIDLGDDIDTLCKMTGDEFLCGQVSTTSSYSDGLVALQVDLLTEGHMRQESFMAGHHQIVLDCMGDGCGTVEALYDLEFPCSAGIDFNAFHE